MTVSMLVALGCLHRLFFVCRCLSMFVTDLKATKLRSARCARSARCSSCGVRSSEDVDPNAAVSSV